MTALIPAASRLAVRRTVFDSVWLTARRYQPIVLIRRQFPVFTPHAFDEFRLWVNASRPMLFAGGVTSWLSSWFASPATPVPTTPAGPGGGRRRVNAKHLLPHEIKRLLENSADYVCHRTDNEAAGTCREPVYGVTEQHLKKNPMAPDGVWAVVGVRGFRDYGRYLVIYPRYSGSRTWRRMDPPAVLCEVTQLDPDDAIGWCTQEDVDEALTL